MTTRTPPSAASAKRDVGDGLAINIMFGVMRRYRARNAMAAGDHVVPRTINGSIRIDGYMSPSSAVWSTMRLALAGIAGSASRSAVAVRGVSGWCITGTAALASLDVVAVAAAAFRAATALASSTTCAMIRRSVCSAKQ